MRTGSGAAINSRFRVLYGHVFLPAFQIQKWSIGRSQCSPLYDHDELMVVGSTRLGLPFVMGDVQRAKWGGWAP